MAPESAKIVQLPTFDVSKPLNPQSLSCLNAACKEWGFFQIINHGISKDVCDKIRTLTNNLFCLPSDIKLKLGPSSCLKTYTPHFIASPFFESLRVSGPDFATSAKSSQDVLVGPDDSEFGVTMQEYGNRMTELSKSILKCVLMSLGEEVMTTDYDSEFKNCHGYMRINKYSPPLILKSEDGDDEEEAEGLGKHTDMSCITIVFQDELGGLQVRSKDGKWMDIAPCEGSLVVNIGDLLQAWSNDELRSSEHRVVFKKLKERFSLAFFWCFEDQKIIQAPDEVVGGGKSRLYKPFNCLDYLKFRESSEKGKFEKVGFTVKDFAGVACYTMK
ncbi:oxygenase [Lithospermum erythrorhizon]|uniref:Oxygenase n=1 Tax=Lithospermum erythrorhizon TaxID=34254 RepID=A0AAV3S1W9_LITER